ncbi:DNA polymerase III gamma subunit [Achromobacter phage Motura]|uniref:DNA polymerase III gamma subunit n=1 Tax=Achromobacter phage Motura TaxID=2591403 RepID=A0A514CSE4_9CAUD|nr:clamp loader of DNA polymerase [Achromobacter phage Motura]QDH83395.1 DNA polymerase III gamma subunit [Achromobacter phage Motura]
MTAFHLAHRPRTLDKLIGHSEVVTRLQGMVKTGKIPNAILFTGPSSAGKTTLARAFAAAINGVDSVDELTDYKEMNGTDQKTIEDIRQAVTLSRYAPTKKKRVIVIDEAQGIISNPQAAAALLKPLEEPAKNTVWILCSMDPQKFTSGNGKALANRCSQFVLQAHTINDLTKQAKRIIKREKMDYAEPIIDTVVQNCNMEMRTLANLLEGVQQYYDGLDKKDRPKKMKESDVAQVLSTVVSSDEKLAVEVMVALYAGQYAKVQRALLDVQNGFQFVTLLLQANQFLLNSAILKGERHPKLAWWSATNKELQARTKKMEITLGQLAAVNERLVECKSQAQQFLVSPEDLLSAKLYRAIKDIFAKSK